MLSIWYLETINSGIDMCSTVVSFYRQVWLGDLANEMKDTLKQLLVDCLNASRKGSGGGVDPSKFPSQVWKFVVCLFFTIPLSL